MSRECGADVDLNGCACGQCSSACTYGDNSTYGFIDPITQDCIAPDDMLVVTVHNGPHCYSKTALTEYLQYRLNQNQHLIWPHSSVPVMRDELEDQYGIELVTPPVQPNLQAIRGYMIQVLHKGLALLSALQSIQVANQQAALWQSFFVPMADILQQILEQGLYGGPTGNLARTIVESINVYAADIMQQVRLLRQGSSVGGGRKVVTRLGSERNRLTVSMKTLETAYTGMRESVLALANL